MPANELTVSYAEHEIRVVKTPTDGARLYIDGKSRDVTNDLFESEDEPTLVGMFGDNTQVEAYVKPTQVSVRVNGEWVAGEGEQAYAAASD
ncbi:MAG: hypothetical protein WAK48_22310 [Candidatus Acidiferrum sp.]|jgi:hypothetical protein